MTQRKKAAAAWGLSALWMAVIFIMSAMPGDVSGEQSGTIVRILLWLFPGAREAIPMLEFLVRKAAHMTEYGVLFLLYRWALSLGGVRRAGIAALVMTVCYAATDEFHQMFTPDRGPSPVDVMIDGCGALIAWGMAVAFEKVKGRFRK